MTREEAIQVLKEKRQTFIDEWADLDDIVEAFDMAITVLSKADNAENPKCIMSHEEAWAEIESDLITEVIDHDREWIIGCIKHDGFIHTHRFDKANQIILEALEPTDGDLISRVDAIEEIDKRMDIADNLGGAFFDGKFNGLYEAQQIIKEAPSVSAEQVTSKLKNPCDSLLKADSEDAKEHKRKLDGDLISRTDAIEAVCRTRCGDKAKGCPAHSCLVIEEFDAIPSADAVPTVIRSKTLMPTKDFKVWAKRIREENPNAVIIPCDAEVVSANAVQGEWIEVEVFPEVYDIEGVKTWGSEMQCDQCGFRHTAIEGHMAQYNFCPNCGAIMKGGEE